MVENGGRKGGRQGLDGLCVVTKTSQMVYMDVHMDVYMDGVVREVNVNVIGKGLELLSDNGGRFEINQLLFADDTALVADSDEKLCILVSEFGRVCERRKL